MIILSVNWRQVGWPVKFEINFSNQKVSFSEFYLIVRTRRNWPFLRVGQFFYSRWNRPSKNRNIPWALSRHLYLLPVFWWVVRVGNVLLLFVETGNPAFPGNPGAVHVSFFLGYLNEMSSKKFEKNGGMQQMEWVIVFGLNHSHLTWNFRFPWQTKFSAVGRI